MATSNAFMEYVQEQLSGAGTITYKKMFGEYGLYCNGKIIGLVCDNQLFLKVTEAGRNELKEVNLMPAYEGAKPTFLIDSLEDKAFLARLVLATYKELPEAKPKKKTSEKGLATLSKLPNIGKVLDGQLKEVGIATVEQLRQVGSKEAWLKIKRIDASACINRLYALEGAIQGIRWHDLETDIKEEIKRFYHQHTTHHQ